MPSEYRSSSGEFTWAVKIQRPKAYVNIGRSFLTAGAARAS